jgi:hypothetical protein
MSVIDWAIVVAYLVWVVWDGVRLSRNTDAVEGLLSREPQPAVVGRRPVGDGHAA